MKFLLIFVFVILFEMGGLKGGKNFRTDTSKLLKMERSRKGL